MKIGRFFRGVASAGRCQAASSGTRVERPAVRPARVMCAAACLLAVWTATGVAVTPAAERRTLPNGARLVVSEQHALPMVVVQILIDAGSRRDPRGKEGLASLTADLLTEGTPTRTASQISEAADFIGASLGASAGTDFATVNLTVLRKELDRGLDLLTDILLHPTFRDAEVVRRREAALAAMRARKDNPGSVAQRAFVNALFNGEPYGHLVIGNPTSVRRLTRGDLVAFYRRNYRPGGAIVTVAGDVVVAQITRRLRSALGEWRGGTARPFTYPTGAVHQRQTVRIDKPITQANVVIGGRGIARNNPDYYALRVMNYILGGGGFSSRLLDNIRTKAGLAYSVSSFFTTSKAPGSFQVVLQTKNRSANDAIQRACGEIARLRQEPVSDEELESAKLYLTGSFPLRLDTTRKIAGFLSQVEFFNLGADYAESYPKRIRAVTKEDVLRVAQQYLHPERMDLVVVADQEQAKVSATAGCSRRSRS
ncbi:MAG: M16 family metallopeptidase [Candidatus Binatia bacterium]